MKKKLKLHSTLLSFGQNQQSALVSADTTGILQILQSYSATTLLQTLSAELSLSGRVDCQRNTKLAYENFQLIFRSLDIQLRG